MTDLIKLREQQAQIVAEARANLDSITDETEEVRVKEIEEQFDRAMADYDSINERAERIERVNAAEERLNAGDSRAPQGENREATPEVAPEYREVFKAALRYGVNELNEEEREVFEAEQRAQSVGTDSAGGYTVPTEFSGEIDKAMAAWGPMWDANIVRELNTGNGRRIEWPVVDDTAKTGRIKAENADVDDDGTDDVTFGQKLLDAYVYDTGMVKIPLELLQDSYFDMEGLLNELFGERLGRTANAALTTGTGTSQPNGVVTAATANTAVASATAVTSDELIDHLHSVDPAYRASPMCRWMFNDSTLSAIRKLKDGQGNYLWQMGDVRTDEPNTLLGHPYSINQAMASMAIDAKPILFGDFSKYVVRKAMGFQVMTLRERYAEAFQVGMVGFKRFDGELLNASAIKALVNAAA